MTHTHAMIQALDGTDCAIHDIMLRPDIFQYHQFNVTYVPDIIPAQSQNG